MDHFSFIKHENPSYCENFTSSSVTNSQTSVSSISHTVVRRTWRFLSDCFLNADTARCSFFFLHTCIYINISCPILPSSISGTIRLPFCSSDTCHPVSSHTMVLSPPSLHPLHPPSPFLLHHKGGKKPQGYWLLFTNQPLYLFLWLCSHWWDFLPVFFVFFQAGTKFLRSLGKTLKWGNNIDVCVHTVVSLLPGGVLGYTVLCTHTQKRERFCITRKPDKSSLTHCLLVRFSVRPLTADKNELINKDGHLYSM